MSLSDAMQTVLRLAAHRGGTVRMNRLVRHRVENRNQTEAVARASLSRSVRRMWKRGLVELVSAYRMDGYVYERHTATRRHEAAKARYERIREDSEGEYERYCQHWRRLCAAFGQTWTDDKYGSAEAFLEAYREEAERDVPSIRVTSVALTIQGMKRVPAPIHPLTEPTSWPRGAAPSVQGVNSQNVSRVNRRDAS